MFRLIQRVRALLGNGACTGEAPASAQGDARTLSRVEQNLAPGARPTVDRSALRFCDEAELWEYPDPELADIDELLRYHALLYPSGVAIKAYEVRKNTHWPDYYAVVEQFYELAGKACWVDVHYLRHGAEAMLEDPSCIAQADLAQLKSLLTYCTRGERFCDGHWGTMIEQGHVLAILQRLAVLRKQM